MIGDIYLIGALITALHMIDRSDDTIFDAILGMFIILTWPIFWVLLGISKLKEKI